MASDRQPLPQPRRLAKRRMKLDRQPSMTWGVFFFAKEATRIC